MALWLDATDGADVGQGAAGSFRGTDDPRQAAKALYPLPEILLLLLRRPRVAQAAVQSRSSPFTTLCAAAGEGPDATLAEVQTGWSPLMVLREHRLPVEQIAAAGPGVQS